MNFVRDYSPKSRRSILALTGQLLPRIDSLQLAAGDIRTVQHPVGTDPIGSGQRLAEHSPFLLPPLTARLSFSEFAPIWLACGRSVGRSVEEFVHSTWRQESLKWKRASSSLAGKRAADVASERGKRERERRLGQVLLASPSSTSCFFRSPMQASLSH